MPLSSRHLLGLQGVPKEDIELILDTATTFREVLDRHARPVRDEADKLQTDPS